MDLIMNKTVAPDCTYCQEPILPGEAYNFWFVAVANEYEVFHTSCRAMEEGSGLDWDARIKELTRKVEGEDE